MFVLSPIQWDCVFADRNIRKAHPGCEDKTMRHKLQFLFLTGWVIVFAVVAALLGRWVIDILIPTLKGGNFEALYDRHHFRYLDATLACTVVGFAWFAAMVCWWTKKYMEMSAARKA
jgi:hypothetical protein